MRYIPVILICLGSIAIGCKRTNNDMVSIFKNHIGKEIIIDGNDTVINYNANIKCSYNDLKNIYEFISVVYIDQNCDLCRSTILDWSDNIDKLSKLSDKYTVMFIYRGNNVQNYLTLNLNDNDRFPFFILNDCNHNFLRNNPKISPDILNASVLIDNKNKIRLIGEPYINEKIFDLYSKTMKE